MKTLPNYFLADLPPEAVCSPAIITEAIGTLKRNREKFLVSRTTENIVGVLSEVAAEWLRPENKFRKLALEHGPEETGFSRAILEKGLDGFFSQCTPANFQALLEQDLGHGQRLDGLMATGTDEKFNRFSMVHGPALLVHIAAGNLPNPALMSLVLGLLTRSAQVMKCASGASLLPRLFAHSVYELDRKLGACLELAEWPGGAADLEQALFAEADCVTATGSDETLAEIRRRLSPKTRFLGYGRRVSFGYVTREVLREETITEVVARAADDVIAWDQNGCLSPHVLYVEERGMVESDKFAELLALELQRREDAEPRGKISTAAAAQIASRRAMCEVLAAHRADVKIWQSRNTTAWTVVFEHETRFQFSCLNRFIYVKPVPDLNAVWPGTDPVRASISTVGIAAPPEKLKEMALEFARWGAPRVCPLGRMQQPPLTWRHDGRPALGDLVVWTDFEL